MDQEDNYPVKYFKSLNLEETKSIEDIANDSNNIDEPVGEKAEIKEALVCNQNRIEMSQKGCKNLYYGDTSSGDKSKASNKMDLWKLFDDPFNYSELMTMDAYGGWCSSSATTDQMVASFGFFS
ncbi:hypothetical protein ES332_D01G195200v1 [Gossypium tomentosum]|uniref:Uncharacterized protein n=1 Tax=Gossypium tomentosum TaxID=34277 RepID=A0A5D2MB47_GOSTO|nr:hypothetical protein ES332_D01G195200v1 [Gossypium tomentosum]